MQTTFKVQIARSGMVLSNNEIETRANPPLEGIAVALRRASDGRHVGACFTDAQGEAELPCPLKTGRELFQVVGYNSGKIDAVPDYVAGLPDYLYLVPPAGSNYKIVKVTRRNGRVEYEWWYLETGGGASGVCDSAEEAAELIRRAVTDREVHRETILESPRSEDTAGCCQQEAVSSAA